MSVLNVNNLSVEYIRKNDSNKALIGPPAIIPVPGGADRKITLPAPNLPIIS